MMVAGGLLVVVYVQSGIALKPIIAVNVGASAPLIIGSFINPPPPVQPGQDARRRVHGRRQPAVGEEPAAVQGALQIEMDRLSGENDLAVRERLPPPGEQQRFRLARIRNESGRRADLLRGSAQRREEPEHAGLGAAALRRVVRRGEREARIEPVVPALQPCAPEGSEEVPLLDEQARLDTHRLGERAKGAEEDEEEGPHDGLPGGRQPDRVSHRTGSSP